MNFSDWRIVVEMAAVVGAALGGYRGALFKMKRNRCQEDGRGNPGPEQFNRPALMSTETRAEIGRMWDKFRLTETCKSIHEGLDNRLEDIKKTVDETKAEITAIRGELKGILDFLRNGKWSMKR